MISVSLVKDQSGATLYYLLDNKAGLTLLAYVKPGEPTTQEILDFLIAQDTYSELLFAVSGKAQGVNVAYAEEQAGGSVTLEYIGEIPFAD